MKSRIPLLVLGVFLGLVSVAPVAAEPFTSSSSAFLGSPSEYLDITPLMKADKLEAVSNLYMKFLDQQSMSPGDLPQFYTAAMWFGTSLKDYRRALSIIQTGLEFANTFIKEKKLDCTWPNDGGVFFCRANLLRAKAQMLAYLDEVDDAIEAANQSNNTLWEIWTSPTLKKYWHETGNGGFLILFGQTMLPVLESISRNRGEEDAAKALPWVLSALASEGLILDELSKGSDVTEYTWLNYRRILLGHRGEAYLHAGLATEALAILATYPLDKSLKLNESPFLAFHFMNKSKALTKAGRFAEAQEQLNLAMEALDWAKKRGNMLSSYRWLPRYLLGLLLEAKGDLDGAVNAYQEAISIVREFYTNLVTANARREFLKGSDEVYSHLIRLLLKQNRVDDALVRLEESQNKALLDLFGDSLQFPARHFPTDVREKLEKLKQDLQNLDTPTTGSGNATDTSRSGAGKTRSEANRAQRGQLRSQYEKLLEEGKSRIASGKTASGTMETGAESWTKQMSQSRRFYAELAASVDVTTIVFQTRQDPCWILVLGGGKTLAVPLTAKSGPIRAAANKFRRAVVGEREDWKARSRELGQLILDPISSSLEGKERLFIIPDGNLWYIPWMALTDAQDQPLIARHQIGLSSSISLAGALLKKPSTPTPAGKKPQVQIFADPDGSLPHARQEGTDLASLALSIGTWEPVLRTGKEALETTFKAQAEKNPPGILHFATHGILDAANPLFSFLLLQSGERDDGRLEILEIANEVNLRSASLAVLSACNTAMGAISGGNEMVCLQQSFHEAGVPSILASLWEVSDEATSRLMSGFYQRLFKGNSTGQAITETVRTMMTEHPSHWAAFQIYGTP